MVAEAQKRGWRGRVAGTRKTTPGFRLVEKYALLVGGADTHRMDLSSMVMLKDNHIASTGSVERSVQCARAIAGFTVKIEVEARGLADALEAAAAGADIVMLDNLAPSAVAAAAAELRLRHPRVLVEASGGIDPTNVAAFMLDTVDIISMGALTQGVPHVDFSLKIAAADGGANTSAGKSDELDAKAEDRDVVRP